jgi:hypothetical protein
VLRRGPDPAAMRHEVEGLVEQFGFLRK